MALHAAALIVPVVVLRPFGPRDDVISCPRAGTADYLSLPLVAVEVREVLTRVLAGSRVLQRVSADGRTRGTCKHAVPNRWPGPAPRAAEGVWIWVPSMIPNDPCMLP